MVAFCISLSVKWMPLWLGQRLSKDYLPPEENLQPTKRGRRSGQGQSATPPLPSVRRGKHIQGVMSRRVEPRLCRWWGAGDGCPGTAGCLLQGSGAAWSSVARIACCQVSRFRQDRKWGCEAIVRLPQHPIWPRYPQLCYRAVYGNKLL